MNMSLFVICLNSQGQMHETFRFQWGYVHCWIILAEAVLPYCTAEMFYTQNHTFHCCPYTSYQLCNWRGVVIWRLYGHWKLSHTAKCLTAPATPTTTWTFPMGCCTKVPFSSDNKILLMETQTDEILSVFCMEQQIHQRSGTNGMVCLKLSCLNLY